MWGLATQIKELEAENAMFKATLKAIRNVTAEDSESHYIWGLANRALTSATKSGMIRHIKNQPT